MKNKGITLIALIVTIVVLLILAGVSLSLITGSDGIIKKAIEAKEQTEIKAYTEKIELIKMEIKLENEKHTNPTIEQLKNEFDENQKNWVSNTEEIMDNDIEKLKLTTKEGYIFYITGTTTEYKGKGEVVDTSDLEKDDVLKLEIVGTSEKGELIQITNLTDKTYYKIKYKIGEEGEWTEITSGEQVDVAYGETIKAKLIYGSNEGKEYGLTVGHTSPTVKVSDIDLTNTVRKTDIALTDIFNVTWGSEGTGKIYYKVKGTLEFNNTKVTYDTNSITNISQLELGIYKIDCYIATPTQVENNESEHKEEWSKEVKITELADTTVTNASNSNVSAYAIYSEYDLAYFRDLVNGGNASINGKVMKDLDLVNVSSATVGSWKPIGDFNSTQTLTEEQIKTATVCYKGIFEGNDKEINNIYINELSSYRRGLFSLVKENAIIKNIVISGNISAYQGSGSIAGNNYAGNIINCINNVQIQGTNNIGGIVGTTGSLATIQNCKNNGNVTAAGESIGGIVGYNRATITNCINGASIKDGYFIGGIIGKNEGTVESCCNIGEIYSNKYTTFDVASGVKAAYAGGIVGFNNSNINKSINKGKVESVYRVTGGITGRNYGTITDCCNAGDVKGELVIGGIVGNNRGYVLRVYNIADKIEATLSNDGVVGGIAGNQNTTSDAYIKYVYNKAKIIGYSNVGGCIGSLNIGTLSNAYNIGTIQATTSSGKVYGSTYSTSAITSSDSTTESAMIGWSQETINSKIGSYFKKKTDALPILNITVNGITF